MSKSSLFVMLSLMLLVAAVLAPAAMAGSDSLNRADVKSDPVIRSFPSCTLECQLDDQCPCYTPRIPFPRR